MVRGPCLLGGARADLRSLRTTIILESDSARDAGAVSNADGPLGWGSNPPLSVFS